MFSISRYAFLPHLKVRSDMWHSARASFHTPDDLPLLYHATLLRDAFNILFQLRSACIWRSFCASLGLDRNVGLQFVIEVHARRLGVLPLDDARSGSDLNLPGPLVPMVSKKVLLSSEWLSHIRVRRWDMRKRLFFLPAAESNVPKHF